MVEGNPYPHVFPFFFLFIFYLATPSFMVIKLLVAHKNMTPPKNISKFVFWERPNLASFQTQKHFMFWSKSQTSFSDERSPS
jgi:hypothetical protein